jgi:methylmalonyl-CoA mutase N-terminal domain/subunit
VTNVADPVGGSYAIEQLTDEIERGARDYIERIDAMGGTLAAIERNYIQNEIQNAAYDYQQRVERGEAVVVGVNRFQQEGDDPPRIFRLDPELERQQVARLRELRVSRSATDVESRLAGLEQAARGSDNLIPHILNCSEAYATVGEISDRLRRVFGEYQEH